MTPIKKIQQIHFTIVDESKALHALRIYVSSIMNKSANIASMSEDDKENHRIRIEQFKKLYNHSWFLTIKEIWIWGKYIFSSPPTESTIEQIYQKYVECLSRVEREPMQLIRLGQNLENTGCA